LASFTASTYASWPAGHGHAVSALALVLPRRDRTGPVCGDQRVVVRRRRFDGRRGRKAPRASAAALSGLVCASRPIGGRGRRGGP
jgi:hypothetical protein